jgi:hypothetical protein
MGNENQRHAPPIPKFPQQVEDGGLNGDIQRGGGFVGN